MRKKSRSGSLARHTLELAAASAHTIANRTQRIAAAGLRPSAADRRENVRMVQEKVEACAESAREAGLQLMKLQMGLGTAYARLWQAGLMAGLSAWNPARTSSSGVRLTRDLLDGASRLQEEASGAGSAVMKAFRRRAVGNARRLSRKKRG